MVRFARFAFFVVAGTSLYFVAALNMQPWIAGVGTFFADKITIVPGLGLLAQIPFIGGWFKLLAEGLGMLIGLALWAWLQTVQIAPILTEHFALPDWLEEQRKYRTWAYVIELVVCSLFFPPLVGGWSWDSINYVFGDASIVDWSNLGVMIATILGFEMTVGFMLKFYRGYDRSILAAMARRHQEANEAVKNAHQAHQQAQQKQKAKA